MFILGVDIPTYFEEEDRTLVQQHTDHSGDEGDIDNGEYWGEVEDHVIESDLPTTDPTPDSTPDPTLEARQTDQAPNEAFRLLRVLIVMLAKWSYKYSIAQNAFNSLLKLIGLFFSALYCLFPSLSPVLSLFPVSTYAFKMALSINENNFIQYVVCPSCYMLYDFKECFDHRQKPKTCSYVQFPEHRMQAFRLPCNSRLLSEITLKSGCHKYYPRKFYCFKSVSESLRMLVDRKGFLTHCENWRLRRVPSSTMCDIYDGQIWKDFQCINGVPFLAVHHNLALMLNIDWFRPYKHTPYSVGAIYMIVTNLPRSIRFRKENVILVGIVPGPSEPPLNMNSFLKPLVDDLISLWTDGITVSSPDSPHPITVKAALICVACDIPACRKVLGFYGHMSRAGCSKCTKLFDFSGTKIDFGGFSECPLRSEHDHRQQAFAAMRQKNAAARDKIEKEHGSRFTAFMELPYFDTVRCHVIDPMHNLYLGTSKYIMKQILDTTSSAGLIQERVDGCIVPSSLGRIPHKISSAYASLTADQWKTWTTVFSLYALHGILDSSKLECWRLFVQACQLLTCPMITTEDAEKGHKLLLDFCTTFESLYGSEKVTPNMHLHTHLLECIKDYGPIYSFWLFSFERYNGMLGSYKTNQRSIELQLMRRFMSDLQLHNTTIPEECVSTEDLDFLVANDNAGTLMDTTSLHSARYLEIVQASAASLTNFPQELWSFLEIYSPGGVMSTDFMERFELEYLAECYCSMYPGETYSHSNLSAGVQKYSQMKVGSEIFGSQNSRSKRSSYIRARWCGRNGRIDASSLRPGVVSHFIKHSVSIGGMFKPHYFAVVDWFESHPSKDLLGAPIELWCHDLHEAFGPASFLPVQRIYSKFVGAIDKITDETMLVVMPLPQKVFI